MLSQEQRQTLLSKTRNKWSQAQISAYLTQECGLSIREAYHERNWAIKVIQDEIVTQAKEDAARPPGEKERIAREQAEEAARRKEEDLRQRLKKRNPAYPYDAETHPELECATCGDPTFYCDCSCKGASYIPF